MVKRKSRKAKSRKTVRKPTRRKTVRRRKTARRKVASSIKTQQARFVANYWALQKKVNEAWSKLRADVRRRAEPRILLEDRDNLLLLLGECNYMAEECARMQTARRSA